MAFANTLWSFITWDVNPDVFELPILHSPVRWYGLLFALGFLLSQQVMYFIYKWEGRPAGEVDTLTIYIAIATVIGARLGHILFYSPVYYFHNPSKIIATWEGGLASHGAGIAIFIALYLFTRKTKVNYLWLLDRVAIITALTGCLIRLGNLMNSEMVGLPTSLPWGFVFVGVDDIPRHPAQLYEAIYCFVLFIALFWAWYKYRERMTKGSLFSWFLIILFSLRFIDEFFKMNQESFEDGLPLNMGQWLSIPFVLAGLLILIRIKKKRTATFDTPPIAPRENN
jgi:phosphatidylglycerol:prolipoprotein diacylglycerol transferase